MGTAYNLNLAKYFVSIYGNTLEWTVKVNNDEIYTHGVNARKYINTRARANT